MNEQFSNQVRRKIMGEHTLEEGKKYLVPGEIEKILTVFHDLDPYVQSVIISSAILLSSDEFARVKDIYHNMIEMGLKSTDKWVTTTSNIFKDFPKIDVLSGSSELIKQKEYFTSSQCLPQTNAHFSLTRNDVLLPSSSFEEESKVGPAIDLKRSDSDAKLQEIIKNRTELAARQARASDAKKSLYKSRVNTQYKAKP